MRRSDLVAVIVLCALTNLRAQSARFPVDKYGAKADGRANDTAAINQAIEAAQAAGGGTVVFPAGTYLACGIHLQSHVALFNQSWPRALLGRTDEAREQAMTGVRLAEANDDRFNAAWNHAVLGFIDLSLADLEGARRNLESAVAWLDRLHSAEAAIIPCVPDLVVALVGLVRIDDAERHLGRLEEQAQALDRAWARATALRCRALIAAAGGDLDAAQRSAEGSVELLERGPQPFETARSVLVLGQIHRRAKRKRLARESLERARDAFAELGARLWVERAESELARIGGRPSTPFELTETERTIASLVARGQTNQEVADALFVSPSTVQANLKRVYQKLGVRSRTELAAKVDLSPES